MTLCTALIIRSIDNDIRCESLGQEKETGKWIGGVSLYRGGEFHSILLSSKPIFDSENDAIKGMQEVVQQVRESKLEV
ncbi:hypothetical protein ACFL2R_02560 [Patescibacteria group bacterium]